MRILLSLILSLFFVSDSFASDPVQELGITVLMYHRFSDSRYPTTNVKVRDFERQIAAIRRHKMPFITPKEFIDTMDGRRPMLTKQVLLTIDDGYLSFYQNAWPILKREKIPFIIFINTKNVASGKGNRNYMNWDQIREIASTGLGTVGHHSYSHEYFVDWPIEDIQADLQHASNDFQRELGYVPKFFSYPFGEYHLEYKRLVEKMGFVVAFGQHSGVIDTFKDRYELPRFPINENWGNAENFESILNALPLPYISLEPEDKKIVYNNPPIINIVFAEGLRNLNNLKCYSNVTDNWYTLPILVNDNNVEVTVSRQWQSRRGRINCTLQESTGKTRWMGIQYVVPSIADQ